jgi:hypothetical protein
MARNNDGDPMCLMLSKGTTNAIWVKWTQRKGFMVQVYDINWRLTEGTKVPFTLEFFDNARPGQNATMSTDAGEASPSMSGSGTSVFMYISDENASKLLSAFGDADRMLVHFPQGDEPSWTASMEGSRKAASEFQQCIQLVQRTAGTQPVRPKTTSPVLPENAQPTQPVQPNPTTSEMLFVIPPNVSGGHMNVRNGPGTNHGLLGAIPAGQTVRASRCVRRDDGIAGADWCLVTWSGLTGWVSQVGLMPVTPQPTQPVARSALSKDDGGI